MTDHLALLHAFDTLLEPARFKDYGPNGLQVEGRRPIRTLVSGVTASVALIEAAIAAQADAIVVHHGLFWRGQDGRVTGWMRQRLALLLAHDIHLFAYHLPLDAHPTLGNNAQLGQRLGLVAEGRFGEQSIGWMGRPHGAALPARRRWPTMCRRRWAVQPCWCKVPAARCSASPGAPAAPRAISRKPSRPEPKLLSPAKFPSPRPTMRVSAA